jgi:hypothetical protein
VTLPSFVKCEAICAGLAKFVPALFVKVPSFTKLGSEPVHHTKSKSPWMSNVCPALLVKVAPLPMFHCPPVQIAGPLFSRFRERYFVAVLLIVMPPFANELPVPPR